MRLRALALLAIFAVVAALPVTAQEDTNGRLWELLKESRALAREGRLEEAEQKLLEAKNIAPNYADLYAHLGYIYELQERPEDAIHAYCELLRRKSKHDYAEKHLQALFFEGPFPRWIACQDIHFSPVKFVVDRCLMSCAEGRAVKEIAYTSDLLFHEKMSRGGDPVEVEVPASGGKAKSLLNRSTYGYTVPEGSDRLLMRFLLHYRSRLISPTRTDYSDLAPKLMHLLLRAHEYFNTYLGKKSPVDGPTEAYLLEKGPPGAEAYHSAIYIYSAQQERAPVEWARQIAHEYGHLVLPPVGRYVEPEDYASGLWGERLFIQWLAEEAGAVAMVPWPDEAAQKTLNRLWGDNAEFDAAGYLADVCYGDMALWFEKGPDSAHIAGTGDISMRYWLGFMTWVQAALGKQGLQEAIDNAPGTSPADFLFGLKQTIKSRAENGGFSIFAGAVDTEGSTLTDAPIPGALRWRDVHLQKGDTARFLIYLPARAWRLTTDPATPGLEVSFDGKGPFNIDPQDGLSLGRVTERWHVLEISCTTESTPLEQLHFTTDPEV
ncbi:MAG: tetratricopeptide repeat protein [Armatimonadota bacterium]